MRGSAGGRMTTSTAFALRMILGRALVALLTCIALSFPAASLAQEKTLKGVALVIGQTNYTALPALPNTCSTSGTVLIIRPESWSN